MKRAHLDMIRATGGLWACLLCAALLGGCLLGPNFKQPAMAVPEAFRASEADGESFANIVWWELFEDEQLKRLIEIALEENQDVATALERIAEARATLGFVKTDQLPSFGYAGRAARSDQGDETAFGRTQPASDFRAGLDVFFEVDLWGRLRRSTEAARAELLATEAAYVSVVITLVADVANAYLLLLDLDQRIAISRRTLETREEVTRILTERFKQGIVSKLDIHQAEIEEVRAEVTMHQAEREIRLTEHALRVLLGRAPGVIERGAGLTAQLPPKIPAGLPSELLRRRPDIRTAEHQAHAQTARIGVAEALRFPTLSLTGALGYNSDEIDKLVDANATFWSIGADLAGPLFQFGRNDRRVEIEQARARQAVLGYERTVLNAFREVEDALVAVRTFRAEAAARGRQVQSATESARLSRALYNEQFTSYIDVLDAERSLFEAELAKSSADREALQAIVRLYKALGGGWSDAPRPAPASERDSDEPTPDPATGG